MAEENLKGRIWVDGCFDFFHHGHAGALMQARQHGDGLYVGVHTDDAILKNKGPVVMSLDERRLAIEACKWATVCVQGAPYVTDPAVMDQHRCQYVVHGDDITTDANGVDTYQALKDMGRYIEVKRTPNISTTDLISRMLGATTSHHLRPVASSERDHALLQTPFLERATAYATDSTAKAAHVGVYVVIDHAKVQQVVAPSLMVRSGLARRAFYVDGGFDLLHSGHLEFLREVKARADKVGALVVVGLHDDRVVNEAKGGSFPIMNIRERTLCVLQTRYVDAVVCGAPFAPTAEFLNALKLAGVNVTDVLHGQPPPNDVRAEDPYHWARTAGLEQVVEGGEYKDLLVNSIVNRVLAQRQLYEERQRKKGVKALNEKELESAEKHKNYSARAPAAAASVT